MEHKIPMQQHHRSAKTTCCCCCCCCWVYQKNWNSKRKTKMLCWKTCFRRTQGKMLIKINNEKVPSKMWRHCLLLLLCCCGFIASPSPIEPRELLVSKNFPGLATTSWFCCVVSPSALFGNCTVNCYTHWTWCTPHFAPRLPQSVASKRWNVAAAAAKLDFYVVYEFLANSAQHLTSDQKLQLYPTPFSLIYLPPPL